MTHETIIHGYIEGSTFTPKDYRKLQNLNYEVINKLPEDDEYPYLSKSMFSIPEQDYAKGTYQSQIIHFGASIKSLECGDELLWINKFENLLKKLYWYSTATYFITEMDGEYKYSWLLADDIISTYHSENPLVSYQWLRKIQYYD